ncbi:MAG TPA: S8 family serine peptidase, partial [Candidatus Sulfopaludibacter sp.]|nr:S8 family serine peptidase [Candidatus Sulfopaludibacter sp.]
MRKHRLRTLGWAGLLLAFLASPAAAARYILQLNAGANIALIAAEYRLVVLRPLDDDGRTVYLVNTPDPVFPALVSAILHNPGVRQFEPDAEVDSQDLPRTSAPLTSFAALTGAIQNHTPTSYFGATVRASYVEQPAAALIGLPAALHSFATGTGVTVAVIDTGVDPNHPALRGVLVPGYDFTRNRPGNASELEDLTQSTVAILDQSTVAILDKIYPTVLNQSTVAILDQSTVAILDVKNLPSDFGHGTMVAGLIHLVAPNARVMPLKAFRANGSANLSDIVRAIYYAVDNHAKVINMSFSSETQSPSITAAMQYAWSHDVICIASAGNDGKRVEVYPAGDRGVVGVGSTSAQDKRSAFSNFGVPSVRMAAPGEALITTYPGNNYAGVWGTSFSTALTSGGAALLSQLTPHMGPGNIGDAFEHGKNLDVDGMGDSRLDVYTSLLFCMTHG